MKEYSQKFLMEKYDEGFDEEFDVDDDQYFEKLKKILVKEFGYPEKFYKEFAEPASSVIDFFKAPNKKYESEDFEKIYESNIKLFDKLCKSEEYSLSSTSISFIIISFFEMYDYLHRVSLDDYFLSVISEAIRKANLSILYYEGDDIGALPEWMMGYSTKIQEGTNYLYLHPSDDTDEHEKQHSIDIDNDSMAYYNRKYAIVFLKEDVQFNF